ncbi:hypothetical protein NP493_453g02004 [Ridgeia piscesae]|uniref:BMERB domain-containing protein n=1 Tax=Ridgeia piscesae TaxID=27915 RepID=A0AAD9KZL2_RIDPI|nr:hypothetical protein NP493_453g02004 [Ridgeia piscesae]
MGSPKNTHLKRGEVFYIKDKPVGDISTGPTDKNIEKESHGKTEWQLEAERRQRNQRHKDEASCPTPAPRNISKPPPEVSTELARPPSESVVVDKPARVRVKPRAVKTQWYVDVEKRKTTADRVDPEKSVQYTEVIIENGSDRIERPYVIGSANRVNYTDVTVSTKKTIRPEMRFSFNLHDFKPNAEGTEPENPVKSPPARPPTLPSRKTRRAPLPPTIIRPGQTPKRTVNAEKRMSPVEICRQLREIDMELRDLEAEGRDLETQIRSGTDDEMDTSEELMVQWFGLINQRNELVRKEADLMYRQKQQELEGIHEDVEYELRCLMDKPDHQKTETERKREAVLLQELLETVNMRNSIIDSMEEDRIRYIEEDQEIAEVLGMKHLGADAQPPSRPDTKPQKPTNKHQKTNGFIQPVATVR